MSQNEQAQFNKLSSKKVANNDKFRMIDAIAELVTGNRIAPKVAFADASGISHFNNGAANGELRLCVGYELLEIPQANVYAMFEDART